MNKWLMAFALAVPMTAIGTEIPSAAPPAKDEAVDKQVAARQAEGLKRMAKDLGLSEEQKSKVGVIFNNEREKVEAIIKEQGEKLKAVQEETKGSLQGVLTPEQMAKLEKKLQQRRSPKQPK